MSFSFVHISDHHLLHSADELLLGFSPGHAFRKVLRFISEHLAREIDFIVSGGDLVEIPDLVSYETAKRLMDLRPGSLAPGPGFVRAEGLNGLPIYFLPGNHDDRKNFYRSLYVEQTMLGLMNAYFEHDGIRFLCLDLGTEIKGVLSEETFGFLKACLTDQPAIILSHQPVVRIGAKWLDKYLAKRLGRFWKILAQKKVLGILSGHVHISYDQVVNGIQVMGTRSTAFPFAPLGEKVICLWPPHIRVIHIKKGVLSSRLIEVPLD
ncbi:MAG: metallophosphoesterase [Chloroflexi bacterium]|nr:metallophosphoesterase [Chloroflexota bacterium]